jgi:hypothetical protein
MQISPDNIRTKPVFKTAAIDDQEKFRPLPSHTGTYPFHLNLEKIKSNLPANKMAFHLCGDTGGLQPSPYKYAVAAAMTRQCQDAKSAGDQPQFFFHLGDVVYNYGQQEQYYSQFFDPYEKYPNPIFAIAGNHDADVDPLDPQQPKSLDAFIKVFCDTQSGAIPFADNSKRNSNIQPNIYWKLETPLANIIGLYSNVPRFGTITDEQKEWFVEELKTPAGIKGEKALILCLHHAPYSADINHGSSRNMQLFLNSAFEAAQVRPDIVFSGHVHNYQRFIKKYPDGQAVPFIVSGAGGYAELHRIAMVNDPAFPDHDKMLDGVTLENYCDDAHGFLKITIEKTSEHFELSGEYYTVNNTNGSDLLASLYDSFKINLSAG